MAPKKTIGVKNNTNEWFNGEIAAKIAARHKLFRKFKKSKLSVDKILYKEARNTLQALIKDKNWVYQTIRHPQQAYASIRKTS